MIQIPEQARGLIFDCDGTIADTMPAHYRAWVAALGEHGVEFPEAMFYELAGVPAPRIIEMLNERHGHHMPVQQTADYKESLFEKLIPEVMPIEPVVEVIRAYDGKLPMAVATGGPRHICHQTLAAIGLLDKFQAVVTAEDVKRGKPAPDVFLEAARQLRVAPADCVAFEDGALGIEAASAAAMTVIDVREYYGPRSGTLR